MLFHCSTDLKLKVKYKGKTIVFTNGVYSTTDEGEIEVLKRNPNVWYNKLTKSGHDMEQDRKNKK